MSILYVGIDLAKNAFAVLGVNEKGAVELRQPKVTRGKLPALIASLPPCVIDVEACSGAHPWARLFQAHGHTVRLMAPKFVAPFRLSGRVGKNDAANAMAICEAVQRPNMRFVPIKPRTSNLVCSCTVPARGFVAARTATINRIRSLMSEFGVVLPRKAEVVRAERATTWRIYPATPTLSSANHDGTRQITFSDSRKEIAQWAREMHTATPIRTCLIYGDALTAITTVRRSVMEAASP
jgi:transposase